MSAPDAVQLQLIGPIPFGLSAPVVNDAVFTWKELFTSLSDVDTVDPSNLILNPDNVGGIYAMNICLSICSNVLPGESVVPEDTPPTVWFDTIVVLRVDAEDVTE